MKKFILLVLFFLVVSTLYSQSFISIRKTDNELIKLELKGLIIKPELDGTICFRQNGNIKNIELVNIDKLSFGSLTDVDKHLLNNQSFQLYPNPANDLLFFKGNTTSDVCISIISLAGVKVVEVIQNLNTPIDISRLTPGLYFVKINGLTSKFLKKL